MIGITRQSGLMSLASDITVAARHVGPEFTELLAAAPQIDVLDDASRYGQPEEAQVSAASNFQPLTYHPLNQPYQFGTNAGTGEPRILKSIDWGGPSNIIPGGNTIKVYFAPKGQVVDGETSKGWTDYEKQQVMIALEQYEHIINVDFVTTTNKADAYFKLATTVFSGGLLGHCGPPGEPNEGEGVFGRNGPNWGSGGLEQGGYSFITLIHEFGHGFGLAHPHDKGGGSLIMDGVTGPFDSFGSHDLNQGVFTMMSYNDGWKTVAGESPSYNYGYQGTPMALDVAMLQMKYGANTTYHTGNDVYQLSGSNAPGTYYSCIWDAGGKDKIAYSGNKSCFIDLRPATIDYTDSGGGNFSVVYDGFGGLVFGGYSIAKGVKIENATGGGGNDWVVGNSLKNQLLGGDGDDSIASGGGADVMVGGAGKNIFYFDVFDAKNVAQVKDFDEGNGAFIDQVDLQYIDANRNAAGVQKFTFADGPGGTYSGTAGEILLTVEDADTVKIHLDTNGDKVDDMTMLLNGYGGGEFIYFTPDSLAGGTGRYDGPVGYDLVI
ncbi:MAG TPA: M10 family metallopeptidase [Caulobacteraceae bacterium]|jgi:serralysin